MANEKRLDLIDRKKLMKKKKYSFQTVGGCFPKNEWFVKVDDLLTAPTVDAVEVVHGEWVRNEDDECYWYTCSECAEYPMRDRWGDEKLTKYCPNCGAKMDGDGNA